MRTFPIADNSSKASSVIWQVMGPAHFSLTVEASLSMPSSRQGPIAKAAIRAAWSSCANGETHFNLAQDKLNM